ncbi:HlyD family type I secretion periplasmic adaptor subunit [Amylibacter sp. SFDW26]|uniref:HlyD family type I secretion periplasmic adaptor subunit n=1 Tax=Amylibacter sp. SFDW26 TaxID=2652722 RepID=UPI0012614710|nr:HlyD family type I secretion periplasmic adaptor subunit [Amylibacter sp. SFDW26]KAB7610492.1 HlyD family type I secretion periplasmic adaptor subunit [Amylibacter sp. SFDW26]
MTHLVPNRSNNEILNLDTLHTIPHQSSEPSIRSYIIFGLLILSFFFGGAFYWATSSKLDGAVVAPASFVVEGNRKTVEHLEGGIVSTILVSEGDYVEAGQTLIELDSSEIDVDLNVLESQLIDLAIRHARLQAQINGQDTFYADDAIAVLTKSIEGSDWGPAYGTQKHLFDTEARARKAEVDIMQARIANLNAQILGITDQLNANQRQLEITQTELGNLDTLLEKGLVAVSRVNTRRIEIERLNAARSLLETQKIQAKNQIDELKLTALSQANLREEALAIEIANVKLQLASVEPQFNGVRERQKRIKVSAPASGRVVGMTVFTTGGVVRPGAPILDIVPNDETLIVEARINTADIEKLRIGQATRVRLSAFDQGDVPEANGKIFDISADSLEDARSGEEYYVARVKLDADQSETVYGLKLLPGMPADLFVNTGERTAISYLTKPLSERLVRTFIE